MIILRFIRCLSILLCISIPLEVIGWFVLPVALLCASKTSLKLPSWARWLDCADMYFNRDTSVYQSVWDKGLWARYCWLGWRNPGNFFGYKYLSFQFNSTGKYLVCNPPEFNVGNTTGAHAGYRYMEYEQEEIITRLNVDSWYDRKYYEYYIIHKWSSKKCMRIRFGWKIGDNKNPIGSWCEGVMCLQFFIDYSGV